jgi:hypothetical protein
MRRLGRVIGQCAALTPRPKCAGEKSHKVAQPRLRFFVGQATEGGAAHTARYVQLRLTLIYISISHIFLSLQIHIQVL